MKIELDLSNYATKVDFKMHQVLIHQNLLKKVDLASLKSEVDKLDTDKFEKVATGLNCLKSKVDKLDGDKLVPFSVDLSDDLTEWHCKKRYCDIVKKDVYNAKIKHIEDKIYLVLLTSLLILLLILK